MLDWSEVFKGFKSAIPAEDMHRVLYFLFMAFFAPRLIKWAFAFRKRLTSFKDA